MSEPNDIRSSLKREAIDRVNGAYISKMKRIENPLDENESYVPELSINSNLCDSFQELVNFDDIEIDEKLKHYSQQTFKVPVKIPTEVYTVLNGHSGVINNIRWHPIYGHLLSSSSLDHSCRIWSIYPNKGEVLCIKHKEGVKDVRWSIDGTKIITGGIDNYANVTDLEKGSIIHSYKHTEWVTSLCPHPTNPFLFLSGGNKRGIVCWDMRENRVVSEYYSEFGAIEDMTFLDDETFLSSAEISRRNSTDKGLIVWDFRSTAPLSNQIYLEGYNCPCVRKHPTENVFIAQSSADYIAYFQASKPYKMNKRKRYEGHKVGGYRIGMSISNDGHYIVSGSATGSICFYDFYSSRILKSMKVFNKSACTCAEFHPLLISTMAISSWNGKIAILQ